MRRRSGDARASRSTSMLFAAAFCTLVVSVLVVQRSSAALSVRAETGASVSAGTLELYDDDGGKALIDIEGLLPGRPVSSCIQVSYFGTVVPARMRLQANITGPLARYLSIEIEEGEGGSYGDCADFVAATSLYEGSAADASDGGWLESRRIVTSPTHTSYRFTVELADDNRAQGQTATFAVEWEAVPG